jgi:nicotinamidase/pyrazinamidase
MNALILVDLQVDFLPGGALGVPRGDEVIAVANRLQPDYELVVASQDWHPANHASFAANHPGRQVGEVVELDGLSQILWPVHCVVDTPGAALAPGLSLDRVACVFRKGTDPAVDSYSCFFDNDRRKSTGMGEYLRQQGVSQVHLMGLATDYCVRFSALDARRLGFPTHLHLDGCRGVELRRGDVEAALEQMRTAGVQLVGHE